MMRNLFKPGYAAIAVAIAVAVIYGLVAYDGSSLHIKIAAAAEKDVVMYKSPGCECCTKWAEHLKASGFTVNEKKSNDMDAIKAQYGVSEKLASCHTALIGGYIIEGHVPAADIERLLKEKPEGVVGLTAPGMPQQSPGMQNVGQKPQGYDVLSFDKHGKTEVFTRY